MDKKEIILNTIIEEYLKRSSPIGSNVLKERLDFDISASTIRVYFKKLSCEGTLEQLHTSSGRVPTWDALKMYWREKYLSTQEVEIQSIEDLQERVREFGVYCLLQYANEYRLSEIINVNDRYLLIIFEP
ncbi:MAG: HrcA family transcriptional regulator, partial [Epsilonproteobacteria bacterium]|nr:HrcA family transcriptional regulator [Campylobacterota bacterium]